MAQARSPGVAGLDHLVLTVTDLDRTIAFYRDVLGMTAREFVVADGSKRWALYFGRKKINLHVAGAEFDPKAASPTPGSADLCFLTEATVAPWLSYLAEHGIAVTDGPVPRSGACSPIVSVYLRDPDGNLIEIGAPR